MRRASVWQRMEPLPSFPLRGRLYVGAVLVGGLAAVTSSLTALDLPSADRGWLALALLIWVSGAFAVKVPSISATISVSEVFVFWLALLYGMPAATLAVTLDGLITSLYRKNRVPHRVLFNVSEPALSTWLAGLLYTAAGGPGPLALAPASLGAVAGPLIAMAVAYLVSNTTLTAVAMGLETGRSPLVLWRRHIVWLSVNFLGGAGIALLLAVNMRQVSLLAVGLIVPAVFVLYLVYRTWTDRLRDAERHVAELNRLYLSTVEALAIAMESKDQVTHGHVRRVQALSMAIAREIGVTDPLELQALEAGALLHDMGKVSIPDHILNKPGKLTSAEYDLMKLHAPIGAGILDAVDFPYPVVPIVRHHHEAWDGSGYPDGLAGEAIPLGARILAVVDCFDALTSDRPYRRRLSDEEAIAFIRQRSGIAYEPALVEALVRTYPVIRTITHDSSSPVSELIARANQPMTVARAAEPEPAPPPDAGRADGERLWPLLQTLVGERDGREVAFAAVATSLRATTPATTVCIGETDRMRQIVRLVHVTGHGEQLLRQRSVALGEGLTGWVAVNATAMVNSDPALDFPHDLAGLTPRLVAALSVRIGDLGALTLYTDREAGFSDADRARAERAAARLEDWLYQRSSLRPTSAIGIARRGLAVPGPAVGSGTGGDGRVA